MKRLCVRAAAAALAVAAPCSVSAQADGTFIIFYQDPFSGVVDLGACQGEAVFVPNSTALFGAELWFCLQGASAGGISGVEGYFDGLEDTGWTFTFSPLQGSISDGSFTAPRDTDGDSIPDTRRGNFAFFVPGPFPCGCICGDVGNLVKLGELRGSQDPAESPMAGDTLVRFVAGDPPSNARFACPLVTLCDAPNFTAVCVSGSTFLINPATQYVEHCAGCAATAGRQETWSAVKGLYRDAGRER